MQCKLKIFCFLNQRLPPTKEKKNIPGSAPVGDTSGSRPEPSTLQREVHAHRLVALGKVYHPPLCLFSPLRSVHEYKQTVNPFASLISFVILLTVCHVIILMLFCFFGIGSINKTLIEIFFFLLVTCLLDIVLI